MNTAPFQQLQSFLAVARHRSFTGAARELGVTRAAVSQAVRQLEEQIHVVLLARTTRSVALTDSGRRLLDAAGPGIAQAVAALREVAAQPGETVGRVRLSVPSTAVPFIIEPVVAGFRERHPRIEVEVAVQDRLVDIVAEGFDAGVRESAAIERDMVQVRLTDAFRYLVVGAPDYLDRHGVPARPEDLLRHECITFRSQTTGALYAWELERGRKTWRVPVRGGVVTNDGTLAVSVTPHAPRDGATRTAAASRLCRGPLLDMVHGARCGTVCCEDREGACLRRVGGRVASCRWPPDVRIRSRTRGQARVRNQRRWDQGGVSRGDRACESGTTDEAVDGDTLPAAESRSYSNQGKRHRPRRASDRVPGNAGRPHGPGDRRSRLQEDAGIDVRERRLPAARRNARRIHGGDGNRRDPDHPDDESPAGRVWRLLTKLAEAVPVRTLPE
ncbi:MAG: LysR family transcriptional regulator [Deltaproteobacteria bacterium]|nr:MAG: LysR family transcriptional regulator [Deltaproteobacteria bacterium]